MNLSRRGFIGGLLAVVSAPAIVRVESLMVLPAKIIRPIVGWDFASGTDVTRLDVLYGSVQVRSEWTALVPDVTLDEYSERILAPMVNRLAQGVADTIMFGNGASWITSEADGTGLLPKGTREQVPVIVPIRLSNLLREARGSPIHTNTWT